jgi:putative transposase
MFNLAAPPGFRGLDEHLPVEVYQRHLPHWRRAGATYFVTFRLADALPQAKLHYLKRLREEWERKHPVPCSREEQEELARQLFRQEEEWLDAGFGSCIFQDSTIAFILANAIKHFHGQRYFVSCYAIMPSHCHLIMRPHDDWKLESILRGIKGVVAREVNARIGNFGALWQQESYDRIVRDEEHLWQVIQYIGRNPAKAAIPREKWIRWMDPSWEALGWKFLEE